MAKRKESIIPLVIEKEYSSFSEFYENEKHQIFQKILESFEEMIEKNEGDKTLLIVAKAYGTSFDTKFEISRKNADLLTSVNDYFESIEEYESCCKIQKLNSTIKSN